MKQNSVRLRLIAAWIHSVAADRTTSGAGKKSYTVNKQKRVSDLRHLYRSITRMVRSDAVDTLLNHIVEDIVETTSLERMVVLYYNQQEKMLESRVFMDLIR